MKEIKNRAPNRGEREDIRELALRGRTVAEIKEVFPHVRFQNIAAYVANHGVNGGSRKTAHKNGNGNGTVKNGNGGVSHKKEDENLLAAFEADLLSQCRVLIRGAVKKLRKELN